MKALVVESFQALDQPPVVRSIAAPSPGAREVLIDVHAAGLNFADLLVIEGKYQHLPSLPFVPGKEFAGVVTAVGESVTAIRTGDRVLAFAESGAIAEQAVVAARDCHAMPAELSFVDAVSLGINFQTAHFALIDRAAWRAGETVLVTGASGVVGLACVQLAKSLGATVVAGISNPARRAAVEAAGADHVVAFAGDGLRDRLRDDVYRAVGKGGVDIVLDLVGGDVFDACLRAIAWRGRMVIIGFVAGRIPSIPANYLLVKNIAAVGMYWDSYHQRTPDLVARVQQEIFGHWCGGRIRALPHQLFSMESFADAASAMSSRNGKGRVVIVPR